MTEPPLKMRAVVLTGHGGLDKLLHWQRNTLGILLFKQATWIFPGDFALRSFDYVCEQAPEADAIVIIGMPNFRRADGLPQRPVSILREIEATIGKPIIASDCALYWNIFRTPGVAPAGDLPHILSSLQEGAA